jgi:hypothetical protein
MDAVGALPHGAMRRHDDDAIHRAPQTEVVWVEVVEVGEWIVRRRMASLSSMA